MGTETVELGAEGVKAVNQIVKHLADHGIHGAVGALKAGEVGMGGWEDLQHGRWPGVDGSVGRRGGPHADSGFSLQDTHAHSGLDNLMLLTLFLLGLGAADGPQGEAWGVLEQRAGNYTAARRLLRSSLSINSQSEVTLMTWATLEEEQGDPVRAEEIRNLYFQQRTEVVDDASWVMGFLDIIDPALDSVKKLLNLDQPSRPTRQDDVKSTARSSAAGESSETSAAVGSDSSDLTSNDAGNNGSEATGTPTSDFDLDGFIKKRLTLNPAELDAVLEGSDPRGVVSQRRKQRLPRKPLPLLPVP
ncbi:unnamed protein product [Miscanthus lutarioriparius]|uniref:Uncharacterized protein n=1 Tax=Miscanthus lutarioriparius TaxID=422564 RepID=A0A811M909_9POAL|nr:unnamed protein product [Miscanthus lutarioriparius]